MECMVKEVLKGDREIQTLEKDIPILKEETIKNLVKLFLMELNLK